MNATGGSQPHNNMPPYLAVNIWKRTAQEEDINGKSRKTGGGGQSGIDKASSDLQNQINDIKRSYLPLTGGTITGDLVVKQEIVNQSGKVVATQDFSSTSVTDLINKVRFTNGVMGSVCFTKSEYGAKAA